MKQEAPQEPIKSVITDVTNRALLRSKVSWESFYNYALNSKIFRRNDLLTRKLRRNYLFVANVETNE